MKLLFLEIKRNSDLKVPAKKKAKVKQHDFFPQFYQVPKTNKILSISLTFVSNECINHCIHILWLKNKNFQCNA